MKFKGFIADAFILLLMIFIIAIFIVAMYYVATQMTTTGIPQIDSSMGSAVQGIYSFNSVAPLMVVALGLALIGSSFLIRSQPIFFIVFFFVQCIFAFVSIFLSNAWNSIFTGNALSASANLFGAWGTIMQFFPFISIFLGIIFAIAIFAKGD
jgi:hypothetical protein